MGNKFGPEAVGAGRLENGTIRTINGILDVALREAGIAVDRTKGVMANGVSAAKPTGWTNEDFDHAIKNLDAMIQSWTTALESAKSVATMAKDMQVQKSEMDGFSAYGPGAD